LISAFPTTEGVAAPKHTYLAGASEGGAVTTLLVEQYPQEVSGGLAACGPIGDFEKQTGVFRRLPSAVRLLLRPTVGALPGSSVSIPGELMANWDTVYTPQVLLALQRNPNLALQLISSSHAAIVPDRSDDDRPDHDERAVV